MPARQIMLRTVYAIWRAPGIYRRLIRVPVGLERTHYRHFWEKRDQRLFLYGAGLLDEHGGPERPSESTRYEVNKLPER